MKKIYICPEAKIVKIHTSHMIALSEVQMYDKAGKSGVVLSRRNDYWDDEDDF